MNRKLVIAITGATSGIGKATAEFLTSKGYIVYSLSRRVFENEKIRYLKCDVCNAQSISDAFKQIILEEKVLDVVINNAGIGISGALEYQEESEIDKIISVNLKGVINVCKLAIPYLRKSKGKIINIGSIAGELGIPFQTMYSVTKSGIHILTSALANEVRPFGIKVTCVMPGDTKTSFTDNRNKNNKSDYYEDRIDKSLKRMENDEKNGVSPLKVSKVIYKCINKKNPPLKIAVDKKIQIFTFY